ncbi:Protein unc-45 A [Rhizophlyctis rosea]|uniref:Protein unc-45 homolog B n=1 Tax=Rhizophlyctis rosea TaxID=64517 RepID=A0AAD5SH37_9FUNG|nr:Protein unc-45 A [Rhizophlyctis rosea]
MTVQATSADSKTETEWQKEIDDITQSLSTIEVDAATFLKRSKAYEALGHFDRAFADVRMAINMDRENEDAIQSIHRLLRLTDKALMNGEPSLKTLILWASGGSAAAREDSEITVLQSRQSSVERRRLEAANRLAMMSSREPAVAARVVREGGIELFVPAFVTERQRVGEQGAPSLQAAFLRLLSNIALIPETAPLLLAYINEENVDIFIGKEEPSMVRVACDTLATLVLHSLPQMGIPALKAAALVIVKALLQRLSSEHEIDVRVAALNGVIKAVGNNDSALSLILSPDYERVLALSGDQEEKLRGLVPVALSRVFGHVDAKEQKTVEDATYKIIGRWLESDAAIEKTRGLQALAAVFHASSAIGSYILQQDGVIISMVDIVEFESVPVQVATVETLSSACSDKDCRKLIASRAKEVLLKFADSKEPTLSSATSLCLIKLMSTDKELEQQLLSSPTKMAATFMSVIAIGLKDGGLQQNGIEALTYLSVTPAIKAKMASDTKFLTALGQLAKQDIRALHYGVSTIIANITNYRKRLTEEEQQIRKLREMAKEDVPKDDPLDVDTEVAKRGEAVAKAGGVPALIALAKSSSENVRDAVSQAFLNLATERTLRGVLVQQGAIKPIINLSTTGSEEGKSSAAQALAKVAITVNPNLAFKGERATELVRPLISLVQNESELKQFEGLMALTNLASVDDEVRTRIVKAGGVKAMEFLQFSDNLMVRRAATEALCNMMFDETVFASYAGAKVGGGRLRMMVALCDSEDKETRRAASGALAILSSSEDACKLIMEESRGLEVVVQLIKEEDGELVHRGAECVKNLAVASGDFARRLEANGVVGVLRGLVVTGKGPVKDGAIDALKAFKAQGVNV